MAPQDQSRAATYQPQFFSHDEYATLELLTDLILPSDGTPGAREAGVAEFVDFMVASDTPQQHRFRYGLVWLDARSRSAHGHPFRDLDRGQQTGILEALAYKDRFRPGEEDGRAFFRLLREFTVMGFYTTRIGWVELDVPGLRMYGESPACRHADDPEHRSLKR